MNTGIVRVAGVKHFELVWQLECQMFYGGLEIGILTTVKIVC